MTYISYELGINHILSWFTPLETQGVHMTMCLDSEGKRKIGCLYGPRLSKPQSFPDVRTMHDALMCPLWACRWGGCLDNTVAGGHGMSPTEALIKECMEEASLLENFL